jgi:hypothetical protein
MKIILSDEVRRRIGKGLNTHLLHGTVTPEGTIKFQYYVLIPFTGPCFQPNPSLVPVFSRMYPVTSILQQAWFVPVHRHSVQRGDFL